MLGDIHKRQFLNKSKTIAYSGSTIQQNFGEDSEKGFLLWDIRAKDDFDVEFYPVKNQYGFVTVDWKGTVKKTLAACSNYPNLSKFRIRADNYISQADTRQLQKLLLKQKSATEVVFKIDTKFETDTIQTEVIQNELDLRDPDMHINLIKEYYKDGLVEGDEDNLKDLISRSLSDISDKDNDLRNVKWSINKLKFDNTFSYGQNNEINFDNLPGITGIFGRNARGKSSIIGTIAYTLFNTSDRGSIKNLHIVNTRHNACKSELDIEINNVPYRIIRDTHKRQTKNGIWAPTSLKLYKLNKQKEVIEDLTEEQRRETEKIIRGMLGDAESFMMTSLASQGEMNTFIKEKATARKNILSNFLDLTVFDKMNEFARKESSDLKSKINTFDKVDWDKEIKIKNSKFEQAKSENLEVKANIDKLNEKYEDYVKELHTSTWHDYVSKSEVDKLDKKCKRLKTSLSNSISQLDYKKDEIFDIEQKIEKIENFLAGFNLKEIKEKRDIQKRIDRTLSELKNDLKIESRELTSIQKSVDRLKEVPCGDSFPTCKFIKESHKNKQKIDTQKDKILSLQIKIDDLKESFKKLGKVDYEDQIEKYNALVQKKSTLITSISSKKVNIANLQKDIEKLKPDISRAESEYIDLKFKYDNQEEDNKALIIEQKINSIKKELKDLDNTRTKNINTMAKIKASIDQLEKQRSEYQKISKKLRVYDLFIQATSNRGIPVQIIHSMLPHINAEISKILKGIVGFTVELEADLDSNSMDIYINYGDSKRIVELGSGMEKMMASLAIRVALINVSTLPKTNILMIDEGFGALDETNLESCGKLLQSLKKYFKNIIVISHIDQIKDIVDNSIDIMRKGVDSYVYCP
jgi:DNA repair exonuclease SbcCD ATPase subunit